MGGGGGGQLSERQKAFLKANRVFYDPMRYIQLYPAIGPPLIEKRSNTDSLANRHISCNFATKRG